MSFLGSLPWRPVPFARWGWAPPSIVAIAQAIVDLVNVELSAQPARLWDPGMAGTALPVLLVTPPLDVDARTNRAQIGYRDWHCAFPCTYLADGGNLPRAQAITAEAVEQIIVAIDDDPTLGGLVEECRMVQSDGPELDDEQPRSPLMTPLHIEARWQELV